MAVLRAHFTLRFDPFRPVNNEWIADTAAVGLALPTAKRRVAGPCPAPGVVVTKFWTAKLVQSGQVLFKGSLHVVEEQRFVDHAGWAAFRAGAVVGDRHDNRVVELAEVFQKLDQPPDMVIGVGEKPGEYLHHAGINFLFSGGQWLPLRYIGIVARELSLSRDDSKLLLPREGPFAQLVPTVVKFALVLVGPFPRHVMRRVSSARAEIHEEGLVGSDLFGVGDEADRLVHQIFGQVITLFGGLLRLHSMIVRNQFGIILVGLAAEKTVEALEAAT